MLKISEIISKNILILLNKNHMKTEDLVASTGVPMQSLDRVLIGETIYIGDIIKIANGLGVSVEELMEKQEQVNYGVINLMDKVNSDNAREALIIVDKISDMIVFYKNVRKNYELMNNPWDD